MSLQVIGAGVGRTGTHSLKLALERLGFGPTYHMEEVVKDVSKHLPGWQNATDGRPDFDAVFQGYNSAVDWPTASFWRELAETYPDAKFVISNRDAESWYESYSETIHKRLQGADQAPPAMQPLMNMIKAVIAKAGFSGSADRGEMIDAYNTHVGAVKEKLCDRLMVFDYRDGWAPLCAFLGCAVPDEPFPRSNDRQEFWTRFAPPQ